MTPAKKPKSSSPASGKSKAALASLAVIALEQLSDPQVREKVVQQGRSVAELAKTWRAERKRDAATHKEPDDASASGSSGSGLLGDRFGQAKLERRVQRLLSSVADLADRRPELAEPLAAPTATLREISSALAVAGGLPLVKRARAHLRIDQELDQLEQSVFEVSMPTSE